MGVNEWLIKLSKHQSVSLDHNHQNAQVMSLCIIFDYNEFYGIMLGLRPKHILEISWALLVVPAQPGEHIGAIVRRGVLVAEKGDAGDADDAADEERDGVRLVEHVQRDLVHLAVVHRSECAMCVSVSHILGLNLRCFLN